LLPPLLVRGVAQAIADSEAKKVFVCNLMTQPGETDGFTAGRHLEIVREYTPQLNFDYVIVNGTPINEEQVEAYRLEGAEQIGVHGSILGATIEGAMVVHANLLDDGPKVRHQPEKLARAVLSCTHHV